MLCTVTNVLLSHLVGFHRHFNRAVKPRPPSPRFLPAVFGFSSFVPGYADWSYQEGQRFRCWCGGWEAGSQICALARNSMLAPAAWKSVFAALLPVERDGYHSPTSDTCTGLINVLCITKYRCCSYAGWVSAWDALDLWKDSGAAEQLK